MMIEPVARVTDSGWEPISQISHQDTQRQITRDKARDVLLKRNSNPHLVNLLEQYDGTKDQADYSGMLHRDKTCHVCESHYEKMGRDYGLCDTCLDVWDNEKLFLQ